MAAVSTNHDVAQLLHDVQARLLYLEYAREMPGRIESLHASLETEDRESLRRLAHRIKGSALMYGFPVLSNHAAELEHAAPLENAIQIRERTATVVALCHDVQQQIFERFGDQ